MIQPIPDTARLRVTGDVETVLAVPYEQDERFMVGLSDGTLLVGNCDKNLRCRFDIARDGAGLVRFEEGQARVEFDIEWCAVSTYDANVVERPVSDELPLFGSRPIQPVEEDIDDAIPWELFNRL